MIAFVARILLINELKQRLQIHLLTIQQRITHFVFVVIILYDRVISLGTWSNIKLIFD